MRLHHSKVINTLPLLSLYYGFELLKKITNFIAYITSYYARIKFKQLIIL